MRIMYHCIILLNNYHVHVAHYLIVTHHGRGNYTNDIPMLIIAYPYSNLLRSIHKYKLNGTLTTAVCWMVLGTRRDREAACDVDTSIVSNCNKTRKTVH